MKTAKNEAFKVI